MLYNVDYLFIISPEIMLYHDLFSQRDRHRSFQPNHSFELGTDWKYWEHISPPQGKDWSACTPTYPGLLTRGPNHPVGKPTRYSASAVQLCPPSVSSILIGLGLP